MIYQLTKEREENKRAVRIYTNTATGTETKLSHIYTDGEGKRWWGFTDLYKIPFMRMSMVKNITDLYTIGLTLKDIKTWCNQLKQDIRSNDPEKYEKTYATILEMERLATHTADPIRQQLALCTVYILADDERIDYFDEQQSSEKLQYWKGSNEMVAFFLTWHTDHMQRYIKRLGTISKTVLNLQEQSGKSPGQL